MTIARPRILFADPDPGHRAEMTSAMALAGYHVVEIATGRALLEAVARHVLDENAHPVVVVASLSATDPELTRILVALARSGRSPPIVAMGRDRVAVRKLAPHVPAPSMLAAPTTFHALIGAVDRALASIPTVLVPAGAPSGRSPPQARP